MNKKPVLIQGAMSVETEVLIDAIKNKEKIVLNGYEFYKGKINNIDVVISITKVGMVNASVATILGINEFNPSCVINQGVAGGHALDIHKGDIVLGEFVGNMNSYKTTQRKKGEGVCVDEWNLMTFNEGMDIENEKISADINLLEKAYKFLRENNTKVHRGTIVSGDCWNREADRITWYVSKLNSLAEDMETYAVYKVCKDNNIPVLGIRIISNSELNEECYEKGLAKVLQTKIKEIYFA